MMFNNILGIIMGQSELALLKCEDPKTRQTLELIFDQTLRGRNLTRNLVVFAKDQEPRQEYFQIGEKLDLILNLPGKINGRQVYDHIRRSGSTVPILFVSGNIVFLESIKTLRMKDAAIEHVSKPCRNMEYVNKINLLLDRVQ